MLYLDAYLKKHNYTLVRQYATLGDERGSHTRAIVRTADGETHYLYFDASYRRRRTCVICKHKFRVGPINLECPCCNHYMCRYSVRRGWRNTTLDNRRTKQHRNDRRNNVAEHSYWKLFNAACDLKLASRRYLMGRPFYWSNIYV